MTALDLLLHLVAPILVAGALAYVIALPNAPFSPRAKSLATWVIWAIAVLWILVWLLGLVGVVHLRTPVVR